MLVPQIRRICEADPLALFGKSWYIWQIRRCEGGIASAIANQAASAGLSHVLIKIADGTNAYNIDWQTVADLVPPVIQALRARGILCWGWQYVYGYDPLGEADIAIQRARELGLLGKNILGSGFDFDVKVSRGGGAFANAPHRDAPHRP